MKHLSPLLRASLGVTFVLASLCSVASFVAAQICVQPPEGLVSWWPGNEDTTDVAGENRGTLQDNATFAPGMVAQGFSFGDTTTGAVLIGNSPDLQLQTFTIEGWIQRGRTDIAGHGFDQEGVIFGYGAGGYGLGMFADGKLFLSQIGFSNVRSESLQVTDTNFHHIAVTKSGATVKFYVDGVEELAPDYDPGFFFDTNVAIGNVGNLHPNTFIGIIDEPSIYNRALTASEIQAIFNAGSAGKCKGIPLIPRTAQATLSIGSPGGSDTFDLQAAFILGDGSNGIDPLSEAVTLQIGTAARTIPAGAFHRTAAGAFAFAGVQEGVTLDVTITLLTRASFEVIARGEGATLSGIVIPVPVGLTIGDDNGSITLPMAEVSARIPPPQR